MQMPKALLIGGATALFISLVGGFFAMPKMINSAIKEQKGLKVGSKTRGLWEKFPFPINFKVYMFNVTNPDEVQKGGTPDLQEVGPFFYESYKSKVECKDRNIDDTVTFRPQALYYYNQTKSGRLTGDELVTIPNVLLLSIVTTVEREAPGTMSMINKAMRELFNQPDSIYLTVKVRDLLFDGLLINCTVKEFASKAICSKLAEKAGTAFKKVGEKLYTFSMFGMRNGTAGGLYRVKRGIKNATDVARVVEYNKKPALDVYKGEECNKIEGTDGSIFKPFFTEADPMVSFMPDMCKAFVLNYVNSGEFDGIPVFRYKGGFDDVAGNPCYCSTNNTCPKKGSYDLSLCMGTPIVATLPHFFESVDEYRDGVKGMHPDAELHDIAIDMEPITGNPLRAASRMQFNIGVHAVPKMDMMKELKTTMHPILWVEEGIVIPEEFINMIKHDLLRTLWLIDVIKWSTLIGGIAMLLASRYLKSKEQSSSTEVTSVEPFDLPNKLDLKDHSIMRY